MVVYGKVIGNLRAKELIEIKKDASVIGDVRAKRVCIEDGAHFKGYVDMEIPHTPTIATLGTPVVPGDSAPN